MSASVPQRLVPIRPSPLRRVDPDQGAITIINTSKESPSTLTPPKTGIKRKIDYDEDDDEDFENLDGESCKRRINFAVNYVVSPQPVSISRRNARERNRVKQVNNGFATLRQHIPGAAKAKKISKVDTLKQAVDYIRNLQVLLQENDKAYIKETEQNLQSQFPFPPKISQNSADIDFDLEDIASYNNGQNGINFPSYYYGENIAPNLSSAYSANVISPVASNPSLSPNLAESNAILQLASSLQNSVNSLQCSSMASPISPICTTIQIPVPQQEITTFAGELPTDLKPHNSQSVQQHSQFALHNSKTEPQHFQPGQQHSQLIQQHPQPAEQHSQPAEEHSQSVPHDIKPLQQHRQLSQQHAQPVQQYLESAQQHSQSVPHNSQPVIMRKQPQETQLSSHQLQASDQNVLLAPHVDSNSSIMPSLKLPPDDQSDENITTLDTSLQSIGPSFANLVDVYEAIDPNSPDVEDDLLDAIDLWEKC